MRKPKASAAAAAAAAAAACKLALMEPSKSSIGVRTRAKTLALQQSSASYLQLRNRRLEKPPVVFGPKRRKSRLRAVSVRKSAEKLGKEEEKKQDRAISDKIGASSGKKTRNKRGFNPCTFLGDPKTDRTPSTISKPPGTADTKRRMKNSTKRLKPTVHEMDELFSGSEQEQQQQFIKKYNFDPVSDKPLPGRYQWEKLD